MAEIKNTSSGLSKNFKTLMEKVFTPLWLCLISLVLIFGGMELGMLIYRVYNFFPSLKKSDLWITWSSYAIFLGVWALVLLVIAAFPKNRPILRYLEYNVRGNRWSYFVVGLVIGFGMNALCVLFAIMNGDIHMYFDSFKMLDFLLIFIVVFIQSSSEEVLCRVFVYQRLRFLYRSPLVAIIGNTVIFCVYHLLNPGISIIAVTNIAIIGVLLSLTVHYFDGFWCASGIHTAWNFTQTMVFGLPNSGVVSPYSVFKLDKVSTTKSFYYDPAFGIEGTLLSCIVLAIMIVFVFIWGRCHNKKHFDISDIDTSCH